MDPDASVLPFPQPVPAPEDLLAELAREILPSEFPPPIAGADIFTDIWNAVKRLTSFPSNMAGWLWDRFEDVGEWILSTANWLKGQVSAKASWLWGEVWAAAKSVWDLTSPRLTMLGAGIWDAADWVWDRANNGLTMVGAGVWSAADWVWGQVNNGLTMVGAGVWSAADWVWGQVNNGLTMVGAGIWSAAGWVWDQVSPGLTMLGAGIWDAAGWLGGQVGSFFSDTVSNVWEAGGFVVENVGNGIKWGVEQTYSGIVAGGSAIASGFEGALRWLFEHVFDPFADAIKTKIAIPRKLATGQYRTIEELLDDFEDPFSFGSIPAYFVGLLGAIVGLVPALMDVGRLEFQQTTQDIAGRVGLTIPTFADLRDGLLRDLMTEETHDDWLGRAGYSEPSIAMIKKLYFDLPTPSDLIRMAVREVFTPEVVERFGQMEDFPPDFAKYAKQIGISEEWAQAHWGAHWNLPSATQGFQMFHRDVISREDLTLLLRALDVMPFWRDRLIQIAYRVISRVDVRRMYKAGVYNRDQVLRTYRDQGYTPEDAEALTEFVVRWAGGTDMDLPRETIEGAYADRLIIREEALAELQEHGFSAEQAELLLDRVDLRLEKQLAGLAEDIVEADFKADAITEDAARRQLEELGVPDMRTELLLQLWSRKKAVRTVTLTPSQVLRLYREQVIGEPECRQRLTTLGYNETDMRLLMQLSAPEASTVEAAELTKADLGGAFRRGIIPEGELRDRYKQKGYTAKDIDILVALYTPTS